MRACSPSRWLAHDVLGLAEDSPQGAAVQFFLYDTPKILLLLVLMVYVIGWLRAGLHVERMRDYLAGRRRGLGYMLGTGFGAITPFCSCSSIPLFLGFTMARIPLGITLAFCMSTVAASLPEVLMLKQVMRWQQLLLCFLGILLLMFTLVGWLFNGIQLQHIL